MWLSQYVCDENCTFEFFVALMISEMDALECVLNSRAGLVPF